MSHLHSIYDTDSHFSINPITRAITCASDQKKKLLQYDNNSERFTFELPRYIEGHDMSLCNKVEVHYINIASNASDKSSDVYLVDDVQLSPEDENVVILSWLISSNATKYAGKLSFLISFKCLTDDVIDYAWHTDIYSKITVGAGMNNGEAIIAQYSDVLAVWKAEIVAGFEGLSAYDVAVANGYEGTEEEWLASLKGERGEKGDKGDNAYYVTVEGEQIFVSTLDGLKLALSIGLSPITIAKNAEFELDSKLEIPENTIIYGNNATVKRASGYYNRLIMLGNNCRLQDLNINGNKDDTSGATSASTTEIYTVANCIVENCTITNGNEGIVCYGDNCVVRNCEITDCKGNGIRFSSAKHFIAEGNTIKNVNLAYFANQADSTYPKMGTDEGAIAWTNNCDYAVCSGNHIENAKAAFASLDSADNSHAKIVGNTAMNCELAVDTMYSPSLSPGTVDVVVSNNEFANCGTLQIYLNTSNDALDEFRFIVANNLLIDTNIGINRAKGVVISNNIMHGEKANITAHYSTDIGIVSNIVHRTINGFIIYGTNCDKVLIEGNTISSNSGKSSLISLSTDNKRLVISNNIVENASTEYGISINLSNGTICTGNRLTIGGECRGINCAKNSIVKNNIIVSSNKNASAIVATNGLANLIVSDNLSNAKFLNNSSTVESVVFANNLTCDDLEFATA